MIYTDIVEVIAYPAANLFRLYVLFRFLHLFFEKPKSLPKKKAVFFMAYYCINSGIYLLFRWPLVDIAANAAGMLALKRTLKKRGFAGTAPQIRWLFMVLIPPATVYITTVLCAQFYQVRLNLFGIGILLIVHGAALYLYEAGRQYYTEQKERTLLREQNEAYLNQFSIIHEAEERVDALRHDMKNHILALQHLQEMHQEGELREYLSRMLQEMKSEKEFANTGNRDIDSLLNYKLGGAALIGAEIHAEIALPEKLNIDLYDMTVIIGNLMDNAIEALSTSLEKQLYVTCKLERNSLFICVKNTYSHMLKTSDGFFISTKADPKGHGVGLQSVHRAIKKYDGVMSIDQENGFFQVDVLLILE